MTWQPGQRITTAADRADWRAWQKAQKLEQQRQRRREYPRIDYYPSPAALAIIGAVGRTRRCAADRTFSAIIDSLVTAAE